MNFLYWIINIGAFIIPFIFSFHPKLQFNKAFKQAFIAILLTATIFIFWDIHFTDLGVWGFNPKFVCGIYFYNLPIEEVFFFICIPFSCLFTYHCFKVLLKKDLLQPFENKITAILLIFLMATAIYNNDRLYTFFTFIGLAFLLAFLKYVAKIHWLHQFYFSYLILLFPFTITNGLLTGTGLDEPIVWYNNAENIGIRLLTIPVEDIFYGCLLILLNTSIFEYLKKIKRSD